jgi:hypothetical protein
MSSSKDKILFVFNDIGDVPTLKYLKIPTQYFAKNFKKNEMNQNSHYNGPIMYKYQIKPV